MGVWGKILGGVAGFFTGGPLGAVMGAAMGHAADEGTLGRAFRPSAHGAADLAAMLGSREQVFAICVVVLSAKLAKCVHLPRAADVATRRNVREQPWVILHELAHAYHDRVLGFDEPRIREAFERYKKGGRGDKTLLFDGRRVRHYALTDHKEFFAEMTEAYFGSNDFFPFNRAELKESEPDVYALMHDVWESPKK